MMVRDAVRGRPVSRVNSLLSSGVGGEWTIEKTALTGVPIEGFTDVAIVARRAKYCTSHAHKFIEKYAGGGTCAQGGISVNFTPGYVPCACLG